MNYEIDYYAFCHCYHNFQQMANMLLSQQLLSKANECDRFRVIVERPFVS